MKPRIAATLIAAMSALVLPAPAPAQGSYPDHPITIIAPFSAGSATDIWARAIGKGLQDSLGQPVVVENRTGAAGQIGTAAAARAAADGYTLLIGTPVNAIAVNLYKKLPYDFREDFTPVVHMATYPLVLIAGPQAGEGGVRKLVETTKKDPGAVTYGSSGPGSSAHLAGEMLGMLTGAKFTHVPYRGTSAVYPDLISGTTAMLFDNVSVALPQVKAGTVKALMVASPARSRVMPDVPTSAEQGMPELLASSWVTVYAPRGTPGPIVARLNAEINRILATPAFRAQYEALGAEIAGGTPEQLTRFFDEEVERWGKVIKFAHVTVD